MNSQKRTAIFERFSKHNQTPATELVYSTPYELLLAVMLSAQMTDKGVNKATAKLFPIANTPQQIIQLGIEKLAEIIKNINYYKTKAKHIIAASEIIVSVFHSEIPPSLTALQSLPGVGRKTANVMLSVAFDYSAIAVDTHVFRVANRTHLAPGKTVHEVEKKLLKTTPAQYLKNAHHWLVLHGRYICTARKPHCNQCMIRDLCEFKSKNL